MLDIKNTYTCNACGATMVVIDDPDPFWKGAPYKGWQKVGENEHLCPECCDRFSERVISDYRKLCKDYGLGGKRR